MNLIPDLSPGWHWPLLIDNLPPLMFYAMMVVFIVIGFAGRTITSKLLGWGLALGLVGFVGATTGWSAPVVWTVILTIGFLLTVFAAIGNAIDVRRHH
jgi:hypothetical protein